ncbi:MAG: DUF6088 family protein [Gammaproteobacteria bacterium]|nr:DUF6088 family protein [Gammaproteobacteria bacterium]MCY4219452.1 DUF6088 family protein [Gammaproteobacteria bacterium]MCY4274305.1 DUF6088 family protein [Gammaproteobacteria bacterium]
MSIAQNVQKTILAIPAGQIFGYQVFPDYARSPSAVIKAISRLVADKRLIRFSKGKFYVPKRGLIGFRKPSDGEIVRTMLYKDGRLRGYITGLALYNKLGMTTQVPRTITLAVNGGRQVKDFGTIRIKTAVARIPIKEKHVNLLQYLDVLKDIKKIPGSEVGQSLRIMCRKISKLSDGDQKQLVALACEYYGPQPRALVGLLFSSLKLPIPESLALSINPTTTYKIGLDQEKWPAAKQWNVR